MSFFQSLLLIAFVAVVAIVGLEMNRHDNDKLD